MNEEQQLMVETARRIFSDQCDKSVVDGAEAGTFPGELWQTLQDTGLTLAGVDAEAGGSGGSWADALLLLTEAGAAAAPIPLAEHLMAATLLAEAGATIPAGILTIGIRGVDASHSHSHRVRFAESANSVLLVSEDTLQLVNNQGLNWHMNSTIAGESVCALPTEGLEGDQYAMRGARQKAELLGAASRVALMAGAMGRMLEMSVQYVSERQQFGRPLSKFQAIQHQLAVLAGEIAACQRAASGLSELNELNELDVALAKARVGEAVTLVTEIAHQVHGAIGYTLEHALNLRSRRLWQWRDEYGAERQWQLRIGQRFCVAGADQLWAGVTEAG